MHHSASTRRQSTKDQKDEQAEKKELDRHHQKTHNNGAPSYTARTREIMRKINIAVDEATLAFLPHAHSIVRKVRGQRD
jgi:hypothetical protein